MSMTYLVWFCLVAMLFCVVVGSISTSRSTPHHNSRQHSEPSQTKLDKSCSSRVGTFSSNPTRQDPLTFLDQQQNPSPCLEMSYSPRANDHIQLSKSRVPNHHKSQNTLYFAKYYRHLYPTIPQDPFAPSRGISVRI